MLNVLLDIDETLLRYVKKDIWEQIPNRMEFGTIFFKEYVFMLRPKIHEFLNYLFSKFNVSIWTWGCTEYANIVSNILTNGQPHKFKDILSLEDAEIASLINETGGKDLRHIWYDFDENHSPEWIRERIEWRNSAIDVVNEDRIKEGKSPYSRAPMKLFSGYTPRNTILIDDALYNLVEPNKFNMVLVNSFGSNSELPVIDHLDNEFDRIIQILDMLNDHHQSLIFDHIPLMLSIHHLLPLIEYQKQFIQHTQQ